MAQQWRRWRASAQPFRFRKDHAWPPVNPREFRVTAAIAKPAPES